MRRFTQSLALPLIVGSLLACGTSATDEVRPAVLATDVVLEDETSSVSGVVPRNATLAGLLHDHALQEPTVSRIVDAANAVFDLRRLRANQPFRLVTLPGGHLSEFRYEIDRDQFLRVRSGFPEAPEAIEAEVVPYVKQQALVALQGHIDEDHPSLVGSLEASGETVELAMGLADVFAGEIDFNNDLRQGDRFQMLYEAELREGRPSGYGAVLAAEFINDGRRFTAFRYEIPAQQLGDMVLKRLRKLDKVAYVRFASVYKEFQDLDGFTAELKRLK